MGRPRRDEVLALIAREKAAAPNGRVLAVANKSVVAALLDDADSPGEGLERLRAPLGGVDFRWFGPSIRGVDIFAGHDTVVIVGRHELRPDNTDALMRCLWVERASVRMTFADGMFRSVDVLVAPRGGAARTQRVAVHPETGRLTPLYRDLAQARVDLRYTSRPSQPKAGAGAAGIGDDLLATAVAGFEHALFDAAGTGLDLSLIGEHLPGDRDQRKTPATPFDNEAFARLRLTLSEVQDTEFVGGAIVIVESGAAQVSAEFQRRVGERILQLWAARCRSATTRSAATMC